MPRLNEQLTLMFESREEGDLLTLLLLFLNRATRGSLSVTTS